MATTLLEDQPPSSESLFVELVDQFSKLALGMGFCAEAKWQHNKAIHKVNVVFIKVFLVSTRNPVYYFLIEESKNIQSFIKKTDTNVS